MVILLVDEASLKVINAHNRSWNNSVNYLGVRRSSATISENRYFQNSLFWLGTKLRINFNLFNNSLPKDWYVSIFTLYADLASHVGNSLAINLDATSLCRVQFIEKSTRIEGIILFNLSGNPVFQKQGLASYWFHLTWNITVLSKNTGAAPPNRVSFSSFQSARKVRWK